MDDIYVRLGGFNIKISFDHARKLDPKLDFVRKRLQMDVFLYLKSFVVLKKARKVDFKIVFISHPEIEIIKTTKTAKEYVFLLERISDKKILVDLLISTYQFEAVLKDIIFSLLQKNGGFGIHASSVKFGRGAYLFLGSSGAGKSTIADLLSVKYNVISDDMTILRKIKGKYYIFQMPFLEKVWWGQKTQEMYELKKVLFLNKSRAFSIKKLADNELITQNILSQILAAQNLDRKKTKEIFSFIQTFRNYYSLYFDRDEKRLLKFIRGLK